MTTTWRSKSPDPDVPVIACPSVGPLPRGLPEVRRPTLPPPREPRVSHQAFTRAEYQSRLPQPEIPHAAWIPREPKGRRRRLDRRATKERGGKEAPKSGPEASGKAERGGLAPCPIPYQLVATYLVSVNSRRPSWAPSRPMPDCFTPPNGAAGSDTRPRLRPTMPASSASHTRSPRARSRV